jgi:diaminopimelate epimerase
LIIVLYSGKAVEVALREFPKLSDGEIAELCGISPKTVAAFVIRSGISRPEKVLGADGKLYPAGGKSQTL